MNMSLEVHELIDQELEAQRAGLPKFENRKQAEESIILTSDSIYTADADESHLQAKLRLAKLVAFSVRAMEEVYV